jgi:hypothetical protein
MRLNRLRLSTRRWLAIVAVFSILLGASVTTWRLWHLRELYQERALFHDQEASLAQSVLESMSLLREAYSGIPDPEPSALDEMHKALDPEGRRRLDELIKTDPEMQQVVASMQRQREAQKDLLQPLNEVLEAARAELPYHQDLQRKYEWAAAHPWLPVAPDPARPSAIDLWQRMEKAVAQVEASAQEILKLPLPPRLEIAGPGDTAVPATP